MTNSMKDLLVGLGFKPAPPAEPPKRPQQPDARPPRAREGQDRSRQPDRTHPNAHRHAQRPRHESPTRDPRAAAESKDPANPRGTGQGAPPSRPQQRAQPPRTREEIDLAKAYAIRAQKEKEERIEAERIKQEAARIKREAKATVAALLKDKALNRADAELTRHFDYNGKIRRVHVDEAQLKALNAGELGVVQLDGRYLLVEAALAREVQAALPSLLALLVDPDAPVADDPYADPQYQVPDDLVW
jgi:uncharacterized protein YaiL (DUF2058 family)